MRIDGLQFADDYLTKPFHPDELSARIEMLLRRFGHGFGHEIRYGHLTVTPDLHSVADSRTGEEIALTAKQLRVSQR